MSASRIKPFIGSIQRGWTGLAKRERRLLLAAAGLVLLGSLWQWSIKPAWTLVRSSEAQRQLLDSQLQQMRAMQTQAQALQALPPVDAGESGRLLNQITRQGLGAAAQMTLSGDRATVTLQNATAQALAQWLTQARLQARAAPVEASLTNTPAPSGATWSGQVVMSLSVGH